MSYRLSDGVGNKVVKVKEIMTKRIVTVAMDDSLKVVKGVFDNVSFHHLLVVEAGKLTGVISDRDLLRAIGPKLGTVAETSADIADLNKRAHQIMTREPVVLSPDVGVEEAVSVFNRNRISCIPIVNDDGKPVGIVSWRDILKTLEPPEDQDQDQ